jgi:hypothetical protein
MADWEAGVEQGRRLDVVRDDKRVREIHAQLDALADQEAELMRALGQRVNTIMRRPVKQCERTDPHDPHLWPMGSQCLGLTR